MLKAAYDRIAVCNPTVNAVIDLYDAPVENSAAQGPFAGVPFLLKDIGAGIAGKRTSSASRAFADAPPQTHDDELAIRFKQAGLRILGKTNLPELGFNVTSEPVYFGPTRNPFDRTRTAGGSSGGSAAAVASGMVPMAHASDGAGSIRILPPAAACWANRRRSYSARPAHADIYGGPRHRRLVPVPFGHGGALVVMRGADAGAPMKHPLWFHMTANAGSAFFWREQGADRLPFGTPMRFMRCPSLLTVLREAGHDVDRWAIPVVRRLAHPT